jgi:hypothetical protein
MREDGRYYRWCLILEIHSIATSLPLELTSRSWIRPVVWINWEYSITLSSSSVVQHLIGPLPLAAALLFKIHHESSSSHSSNTVSGRQAQAACQEIIVQRAVHNMLLSLHNLILSAVWTFSLRSSRFRYRREDGLPLSLMLNLMVKLTLAVSAISSKKTKTFLSEIWTEFVKDPIDSSTRYERISRRKG